METLNNSTSLEFLKPKRWPLPSYNIKLDKELVEHFRKQVTNYKKWHDKLLGTNEDGMIHLVMDLKRLILWNNRRLKAAKLVRCNTKEMRTKIKEIISEIVSNKIMTKSDPVLDACEELISTICDQKIFDEDLTEILRTIMMRDERDTQPITEESDKENAVETVSNKSSINSEKEASISTLSSLDDSVPNGSNGESIDTSKEAKENVGNESIVNTSNEKNDKGSKVVSSKSESDAPDTVKTVWMHQSRLNRDVEEERCFICQLEPGLKDEPLQQCSKKGPGGKCQTRFHMSCAQGYNAGDFNFEYLKTLVGSYYCPLHHCDLCWFERKKNTATLGRVYECSECYRAFHDLCRPAGSNIQKVTKTRKNENSTSEVTVEQVTCHVHSKYSGIKNGSKGHLPFCCECEDKGTTGIDILLPCSQCIRSYHARCRRVEVILGSRFNDKDPLCESCIHGESIRINQFIIAKYNNGYFAGTSVALSDYPAHCKSLDKYGSKLNQPGYIAVKWAGCANLFSLLPASTLVPMFSGSFSLIGKNKKDRDYIETWRLMDDRIYVPRPVFNVMNEKYTKIKTSVYHSECPKPRLAPVQEEDVMCDCPEEPDRCGPKSKCQNRSTHQECPESCEKKKGGCSNRYVSRKSTNPDIVAKGTELKGTGVFATARVPQGSFIAEYAGEIISLTEKQRRIDQSARCKNDEEKHYMMQLDKNRVIDCKYKGNIARFLNHSCDPNCVVETIEAVVSSNGVGKGSTLRYDRRVAIFTKRDVEIGEELCFNYDMQEYTVGTPLPECRCEAINCTGKLGRTELERREKKKDGKNAVEDKVEEKSNKRSRKRGSTPETTVTAPQAKRNNGKVSKKKLKKSGSNSDSTTIDATKAPEARDVKGCKSDNHSNNIIVNEPAGDSDSESQPDESPDNIVQNKITEVTRAKLHPTDNFILVVQDVLAANRDVESYLPQRSSRGRRNNKFSP